MVTGVIVKFIVDALKKFLCWVIPWLLDRLKEVYDWVEPSLPSMNERIGRSEFLKYIAWADFMFPVSEALLAFSVVCVLFVTMTVTKWVVKFVRG